MDLKQGLTDESMDRKAYWSSIEYKYGNESNDPEKLKGGFTYVFIKAFDVRDALEKITESLKIKGLHSVEIEFISPYDKETEWETPIATKHYKGLFTQALNSSEVIFDDLYAYENFKKTSPKFQLKPTAFSIVGARPCV